MNVPYIEIYTGGIDRPYREIGPIKVKIGARTVISKSKTIEEVNRKLSEKAMKMCANAIINVQYDRGISMTSWKSLSAKGTAVYAESDEIQCPFCAEPIKRAAIKCKHCGETIQK